MRAKLGKITLKLIGLNCTVDSKESVFLANWNRTEASV